MRIALGADHAGFSLKESLKPWLESSGHPVADLGAYALDPEDDYPDFAAAVARAVRDGAAERGIIVCGSGVGASITANKVAGGRAGLGHDTYSGRQGVEPILGMLAAGDSPETIRSGYGWLELEDIQACLLYARKVIGRERIELAAVESGS